MCVCEIDKKYTKIFVLGLGFSPNGDDSFHDMIIHLLFAFCVMPHSRSVSGEDLFVRCQFWHFKSIADGYKFYRIVLILHPILN